SEWADYLVSQRPELTAQYFTVIETADSQVAVVYLDGKLARVVGPGKRVLFWRGPVNVSFTAMDARETPEVPRAILPALARLGSASGATFTTIDEGKADSCTSTGAKWANWKPEHMASGVLRPTCAWMCWKCAVRRWK